MGSGCGQGANGGNGGANLAYTRFLFVIARTDDDAHGSRLRTAGANIARGFFNDFDIDDSRENPGAGVRDHPVPGAGRRNAAASGNHASRRTSTWRATSCRSPASTGRACRRSTMSSAAGSVTTRRTIITLDGAAAQRRAIRAPEMVNYSNRGAPPRRSGRISRNAIIMPIRKTAEWWQKSALERHSYFLSARRSRERVPGEGPCARRGQRASARCSAACITTPTATSGPNEFDFVTYFECDDEALAGVRSRAVVAARLPPEPGMAVRRRRTHLARQKGPSW